MRANVPVVVLLATLLPAAAGSSEEPTSAPPLLRLVWIDPTSAAPFAYDRMGREVQSILEAADVSVVWDKRAPGPVAAREVPVILLDGETAWVATRRQVMGCVPKGGWRSVVWANLTTTARTLGLDARSRIAWSGQERQQVATALGRVVAHEIVHVLAPELPHASQGLFGASLSASQLVHQRLRLDRDAADAVWRGVRLRDRTPPADDPTLVALRPQP